MLLSFLNLPDFLIEDFQKTHFRLKLETRRLIQRRGFFYQPSRQIKTCNISSIAHLSSSALVSSSFSPPPPAGMDAVGGHLRAWSPLTSGRTAVALQFFTFLLQDTDVSAGCCNPNRLLLSSSVPSSPLSQREFGRFSAVAGMFWFGLTALMCLGSRSREVEKDETTYSSI